jgi:hypothetical protein
MGIMMGCPQRLQDSVANGGRSPGIKTLASHPLQVTIFRLALIPCPYYHRPFARQVPAIASLERSSFPGGTIGFITDFDPFVKGENMPDLTKTLLWCLIGSLEMTATINICQCPRVDGLTSMWHRSTGVVGEVF